MIHQNQFYLILWITRHIPRADEEREIDQCQEKNCDVIHFKSDEEKRFRSSEKTTTWEEKQFGDRKQVGRQRKKKSASKRQYDGLM
jgi:hypothetical protein